MMASTSSASAASQTGHAPEPLAVAMPAMNTGAVAQPRLPLMPCTEAMAQALGRHALVEKW